MRARLALDDAFARVARAIQDARVVVVVVVVDRTVAVAIARLSRSRGRHCGARPFAPDRAHRARGVMATSWRPPTGARDRLGLVRDALARARGGALNKTPYWREIRAACVEGRARGFIPRERVDACAIAAFGNDARSMALHEMFLATLGGVMEAARAQAVATRAAANAAAAANGARERREGRDTGASVETGANGSKTMRARGARTASGAPLGETREVRAATGGALTATRLRARARAVCSKEGIKVRANATKLFGSACRERVRRVVADAVARRNYARAIDGTRWSDPGSGKRLLLSHVAEATRDDVAVDANRSAASVFAALLQPPFAR